MKQRTKPDYWKLDTKANNELLRLALNKLKQRTVREGEKMDEKFAAGERDEKQRSKFYAIWYAFEALRVYAGRKGIKVDELFKGDPTPSRTWYVTNHDVLPDNKIIAGPFTTAADAAVAREVIERYNQRNNLWLEEINR